MAGDAEKGEGLHGRLSLETLDLAVRQLKLPTFPAVVRRVLDLWPAPSSPDAAQPPEELAQIVESDLSLAAHVLSVANRSKAAHVTNIRQAMAAVGADAIRDAVLSASLLPADEGQDEGPALDYREFWRHSLAVAIAASMLADHAGVAPGEAYTGGLLHDVGKLVLDQCAPKTYRRVLEALRLHVDDIGEHEKKILGVTHSVAGRRLAEQWRLGQAVEQSAWLCHQPAEALPQSLASRRLVEVVALADTLVRERGIGFSGNFRFVCGSGELARRMGLAESVLAEVGDRLEPALDRRLHLLGLDRQAPPPRRPDVLADANAELARINQDLRERTEEMSHRAAAFVQLDRFVSGLDPQATLSDTLARIAEIVAAAAGCPVVAYSVSPQDAAVLAVRWAAPAAAAWRTFFMESGGVGASAGARPSSHALPEGLADLGDWVEASTRHRPLICATRWVGGVLYPSPPPGGDVVEAMAGAMAMALAVVQERQHAMRISEELAGASQVLAATQDALAEARVLAATGEMAAGAAHELNNPLAVISGRAQLMRDRCQDGDQKRTWQLVAEQAQRISDILTDLMEFASPAPPQPAAVNVRALLEEARGAFTSSGHIQAAAARVDIQVEDDVPPVKVDPAQLRAVIVELIANAAQAATAQPHIRLVAEADEPGGGVLLSVQDNGPGMDPHTLASVFTPFLSSQPAGRRRGLGLPRAKRHVEINGGRIWVRSRVAEGTAVYILLPSAR